jgi:hypothetical protein
MPLNTYTLDLHCLELLISFVMSEWLLWDVKLMPTVLTLVGMSSRILSDFPHNCLLLICDWNALLSYLQICLVYLNAIILYFSSVAHLFKFSHVNYNIFYILWSILLIFCSACRFVSWKLMRIYFLHIFLHKQVENNTVRNTG